MSKPIKKPKKKTDINADWRTQFARQGTPKPPKLPPRTYSKLPKTTQDKVVRYSNAFSDKQIRQHSDSELKHFRLQGEALRKEVLQQPNGANTQAFKTLTNYLEIITEEASRRKTGKHSF